MLSEVKSGVNPHFMLDCYGCSKAKLTDAGFVLSVLNTLPEKINFTKMTPPSVFKYEGQSAADSGVSGFVRVAESHISIHTFPDKDHVFIDIFSTKEFDSDLARQELMQLFEAQNHEAAAQA